MINTTNSPSSLLTSNNSSVTRTDQSTPSELSSISIRAPSSSLTSIGGDSTRNSIRIPTPPSPQPPQPPQPHHSSSSQRTRSKKQLRQTSQSVVSYSSPSSGPTNSNLTTTIIPVVPRESWETAYVFAFVYKFTNLCHDLRLGLILRTVVDFERALEDESVPKVQGDQEESERSDGATNTAPKEPEAESDSRRILREILSLFHENLKVISTYGWEKWLVGYVDGIIERQAKFPATATLRWNENCLKNNDKGGFWGLDWKDKIHLLRVLVDHQLTYSPKVRAIIDENYEKSHCKQAKQTSGSSNKTKSNEAPPIPVQNLLLIKSLGLDRNLMTWWQIDDSCRLYCSGNPYKKNCVWKVLSSTAEEFSELQKTVARDPSDLRFSIENGEIESQSKEIKVKVKIPLMFKKTSRLSPSKKVDRGIKFEWELSRMIERTVKPSIELRNQEIQNLIEEKVKIEEREARKRKKAEMAQQAPNLTRSTPGYGVRSRLRSQVSRPDYSVDSSSVDRQFERQLRKYERGELEEDCTFLSGKRKRRETQNQTFEEGSVVGEERGFGGGGMEDESFEGNDEDDEDYEEEGNEFDESGGSQLRKRRRGVKKAEVTVNQGERRSLRIKQPAPVIEKAKETLEPEEETGPSEDFQREPASAWSRLETVEENPVDDQQQEQKTADEGPRSNIDGNVSVWSRGKLIFVNGNNKYASRPVAAPTKRKIIAKVGSGIVLKVKNPRSSSGGFPNDQGVRLLGDSSTGPFNSSIVNGNEDGDVVNGASSLVSLQARLAGIGSVDDGEDEEDYDYNDEKINKIDGNGDEVEMENGNRDVVNKTSGGDGSVEDRKGGLLRCTDDRGAHQACELDGESRMAEGDLGGADQQLSSLFDDVNDQFQQS